MDIIMILDKVSAKIALLLLLLVVLKFVTKHLHLTKADRFLMKIHKPASYGLIVVGLVHTVASFRCFSELGFLPYIVGGTSILSMIGAIYTFRLRKTDKKWLHYHRVLALVAIITCGLHPML